MGNATQERVTRAIRLGQVFLAENYGPPPCVPPDNALELAEAREVIAEMVTTLNKQQGREDALTRSTRIQLIVWTGGECPVAADGVVVVRLACGIDLIQSARSTIWEHRGMWNDVLAYCPVHIWRPVSQRPGVST